MSCPQYFVMVFERSGIKIVEKTLLSPWGPFSREATEY